MKHINIVYFGTPKFSAYILDKLIKFSQNPRDSDVHPRGVHEAGRPKFIIQAVVTSPERSVGRRQVVTPSAVALVAERYGIPTLKPEKLDDEFIANHHSLITGDLFIVVSYGKILPKILLDIPSFGAINLHGSLLPKYRGASPIQGAILNGDKKTGVTIMLMDEQVDHGSILATKIIRLTDQDTFESLSNKMMHLAVPLLINSVQKFVDGKVTPKSQNHSLATYTKLIKKEDGYFDLPAGRQVLPAELEKLDRMIRAYFPWPNVWTKWNNKVVKFYPEGFVQMEGKKAVSLKEFLNGYPNFPRLFSQ